MTVAKQHWVVCRASSDREVFAILIRHLVGVPSVSFARVSENPEAMSCLFAGRCGVGVARQTNA